MACRGERTVTLKMPIEEFEALDTQAREQDRTAWQHARHLIRRGLGLVAREQEPVPETSDAA